jgi:tetratricopeptide (TPR) repeat protein
MEFWQLVFSGPGATICVCVTVLVLAVIYLIFNDKFRGLSVGYKEFKVETPKSPTVSPETPIEVIRDSKDLAETTESSKTDRPPLLALFDAADKQDREGIEVAIEQMRDDPPFGINPQELEAFKFNELLGAGFADALQNLKALEKSQPNRIAASLYLARYYFEIRALDQAETHLKTADERAQTDERKVDIALLRGEILEVTKGKKEVIEYLEKQLSAVSESSERFRLLREIGNQANAYYDTSKAILAYEQALACSPEHTETRFKLALIYGANAALKMLGVRHYRAILLQNHLHTRPAK